MCIGHSIGKNKHYFTAVRNLGKFGYRSLVLFIDMCCKCPVMYEVI